ncbi:MAG: hypothetical protein G01um101417_265 [Parcubacteria group bacterium Gr01-1014_17]|nr:MAG: hypothetical protein G01um101417_265 [Parcubacteria group bacterium Gr01-1014_17]
MRKFGYILVALILLNIALFSVNKYHDWRAKKPAAVVSEQAVSAPVRAEQKTYRVSFRVSPVVQSSAKSQ